jgi:hypothetical protein
VIGRIIILLLVLVGLTTAAAAVVDRGSGTFYKEYFGSRVALCVPPATDMPQELGIEQVKDKISARLGYRVEYEVNVFFPEMSAVSPIPAEIWTHRLAAHPWAFVRCSLRELFLRHDIIVKEFFPFASERRFATLAYLPITDTPRSNLFRTTGIELRGVPDSTPASGIWWRAAAEVLRLLTFWGVMAIGLWQLLARDIEITLALVLAAVTWAVFIVFAGLPFEPRQLNPFAVFVYLVQAVALVHVAERCFYRPVRRWLERAHAAHSLRESPIGSDA